MDVFKIKIKFFETITGKQPFMEWVNKLDVKTKTVVTVRMGRVRAGNLGDCKQIKGQRGIWEFRIDYGPGYRVYFGKEAADIVVLLIAGAKSSQARDIAKASRYWIEYLELNYDKKSKKI